MRGVWRALRVPAAALALASIAAWLSLAPGDPALYPVRGPGVRVAVLDHGWHSGIAVAQAELRGAAVRIGRARPDLAERLQWLAARFPGAEWLEIGWGDADFYRATPAIGDLDPWLGLRALLWPTASVMQVVPGTGPVGAAFPRSEIVELRLSEAGFDRLPRRWRQRRLRQARGRRGGRASMAAARSTRRCRAITCSRRATTGCRRCCGPPRCRRARCPRPSATA